MTGDERRKYNRDYYANHREETCAYRRGRYLRLPHRENVSYGTRICLGCGIKYRAKSSGQKYCSACAPKKGKEKQKEWRSVHPAPPKNGLRVCLICGREYQRTGARQTWCPECGEQQRLVWEKEHAEEIKLIYQKHTAKRRTLGFVPLNEPFVGADAHHIDKEHVVYIPHELHRSTYHNQWTGQGMKKINALAVQWMLQADNAAALADYAKRINEPELPAQVAKLWNGLGTRPN